MASVSSFTRIPETEQYRHYRVESFTDEAGNPDFAAIRHNAEFVNLRRRISRFVFPMTVLFLCWYLTYVLLAAYAHGFMSHRVTGSITVGLLLGLSQFVMTVVIMLLYARFTRRHVDPRVAALRERAGAKRS
jgi:uncharacterized membrane protein (DUF485 family)